MAVAAPIGTVTLMFTDIEGSTALWETAGEAFRPVLDQHNELIRALIEHWDGYEVKTQGDSFMVAFARAADATQCAIAIQRAFAGREWAAGVEELRVRIGLHTGEPFLGYDPGGRPDYFGPTVNRAARVAAAGHGGQILISSATRDVVEGSHAGDLQLGDRGRHHLRGLDQAEHLFEVSHPDLPVRHFPPLRTLATTRTNLPASPGGFVGREAELVALRRLLLAPETRLLTLTGFGGMGKTRTAIQLAEGCADDFPDGVWWVELEEARSGEELLERTASQLIAQLQPERAAREQLHEFLQGRQLLLLLDNTEQIPDAAAAVQAILQAPRVKCLVTSRRALQLQLEREAPVPPLSEAAATALFLERARARLPDFALTPENRADIAELCCRLEGVPLAIELAASRIAGLTPREIVLRLAERFRLLQTRSPDLPPRQRALRGAIDWSYDLLTGDDRTLLAELAVFAGGFTLADAEAICSGLGVFEGVSEIRSQSLLRAETHAATQETRLSMLESVRDYAAEKLQELGTAAAEVRQRHATHHLQLAQECAASLRGPEERAALLRLEGALDNVRAAMEWAEQADRPALCAGLALALGTLLQRRGLPEEALRRVATGLQAAQRVPDDLTLSAALLRERAGLLLDQFRWSEARDCAARALSAYEAMKDGRGAGESLNLLGLAAVGERDFPAARLLFAAALGKFEAASDRGGSARAHSNLGLVEYEDPHGDREAAARCWEAALRLHRENDDRRGLAEVLTNTGALAQELGMLDAARERYTEALQLETELRHTFGMARSLSNLGEIALLQQETPLALRCFAAAECLFDRVGSPFKEYTTGLLERASATGGSIIELAGLRSSAGDRSPQDLVVWARGEGG